MGTPWWYLKKRKNPTGVMGRPKSPIPLADRRRLARQQYQTNLTQRGQCLLRLLVSAAAADRLASLAKERGVSPGQIVEDLLMSAGTSLGPPPPSVAEPLKIKSSAPKMPGEITSPDIAKPQQATPPAPNAWFSPV